MLRAARAFLQQRVIASSEELALHLETSEDVARALLQKWEAKGQVEPLTAASACANCTLCGSAAHSLYRWVATDAVSDADRAAANPADQGEPGRNCSVPSNCPSRGPPQGQ